MTEHANFLNIIEGSETVRARWAALVERAVTAAREHGVTLEPDDVLHIREVRLAAMGVPMDESTYRDELLNLPALSDAARRRAIADGNEEARAAAVADVNRGKDVVHPDRWADNAAARLSKARDLGIATPPPAQNNDVSVNERLEMLKDVKDPATRISLARKWGLL